MSKKFDFVVFIGRFQPFHKGHLSVVKQACELGSNVIMVLGSSNVAPNIKNPWNVNERVEMMTKVIAREATTPVFFTEVRDYLYDDTKWVNEVQASVRSITGNDKTVALIGYHKDASTYYLDMFPNWSFIHATPTASTDATYIREMMFENKYAYDLIYPSTVDDIREFKSTDKYKNLLEEYNYYKKYKKDWSKSPYDPSFNCVDAVVLQKNMVLVVTRKDNPGKGLWALPGGFIQKNEDILPACLRELKEETSIVFPSNDLKDALTEMKVFSHPNRSLRGRTYSFAHCFKLNEKVLPQVEGGDDADKAFWLPLIDVYKNEDKFFEDHFQIIDYFVSK